MLTRILSLLFIILCLSLMAFSQSKTKFLTIGLNAAGNLKITKENGKSLGYDAKTKKTLNEIPDATVSTSRDREPVYGLPVTDSEKPFTIVVTRNEVDKNANLAITGENFVIRFVGLSLIPGKIYTIRISPKGNSITYSCNVKSELPTFRLAIDSPEATQPSYIFQMNRTGFPAGKLLNINLDSKDVIKFSDNDKPNAIYTLQITRINIDGSENEFSTPEITSKKANNFELDFSKWKGTQGICIRNDGNRNGFKDEKCVELKSMKP